MSDRNSLPYLFKQNIPLHPQTATERNFSWRKLVEKPINLGLLITLARCGELANLGLENHCPVIVYAGKFDDGAMAIRISKTVVKSDEVDRPEELKQLLGHIGADVNLA